jgi:hypothetical protein
MMTASRPILQIQCCHLRNREGEEKDKKVPSFASGIRLVNMPQRQTLWSTTLLALDNQSEKSVFLLFLRPLK